MTRTIGARLRVLAALVMLPLLSTSVSAAAATTTYTVSGVVSFGSAGSHPVGEIARVTWKSIEGATGSTDTDADGNYSFALLPGLYQLRFEPKSTNYQPQFWNQRDTPSTSHWLELYTSSAVANAILPAFGSISGKVYLGNTSTPAGSGQVKVSWSVCYQDGCRSQQPPQVLTDEEGNYSFSHLSNGVYTLRFDFLGGGNYQAAPNRIVTIDNAQQIFQAQDATLPRAASITGTVRLGSNGVVAGLGDVYVSATRPGDYPSTAFFPTDSSGIFSIPGLEAGLYYLYFDYRGPGNFADVYYGDTIVMSDSTATYVTSGATVRDVILQEGARILGSVRDSTGRPLQAIRVRASVVTNQYSSYVIAEAETAADGTYSFTGMPSRDVSIALTAPNGTYVDLADSQYSASGALVPGETRAVTSVMYRPTTISGRVTCTNCDLSLYAPAIGVNIERNVGTTSAPVWALESATGLTPAYGERSQAIYGTFPLHPGEFRIRVAPMYSDSLPGGASITPQYSSTFVVPEGGQHARDITIALSSDVVLNPGDLVKSAMAPMVYLWTGVRLQPVASLSTVSELGLSTSFRTLTAAQFAKYSRDTDPLHSLLHCDGLWWLGIGGKLWPTTQSVVGYAGYGGMSYTEVPGAFCDRLPKVLGAPVDTVFLKSSDSPDVYQLTGGRLRPILRAATLARVSGGAPYSIVTASPVLMSSIPRGPAVLDPGMLVKTATSPAVLLVDDYLNLIRVNTFESVVDIGLPTSVTTVSAITLSESWINPSPLRNVVTCANERWLATGGRLVRVPENIVGSLPTVSFSEALCATVAKTEGGGLSAPVILKSPTSASLFQLTGGTKRSISSSAALASLTAGRQLAITVVGSTFLASLPSGTDVVAAGMLVKTASNPSVYLYDGSGGLISLSSIDPVAEMGLSTAITVVSPKTISDLVVRSGPLRNLISCDGIVWLATGGRLVRVPSSAVGSFVPTALPASLCMLIAKAPGQGLAAPVFIKSATSAVVYQLDNGMKRQIMTGAALSRIAAGASPVITLVRPAFLSSLPTGSPIS